MKLSTLGLYVEIINNERRRVKASIAKVKKAEDGPNELWKKELDILETKIDGLVKAHNNIRNYLVRNPLV